ncbi:MAG: Two-component system regulatory protein [Myxococcales bacterium]|nr:Two-component system regulatory protein [Myxococcales bacterium]
MRPSLTTDGHRDAVAAPVPGVVLVFSTAGARAVPMRLCDGALDIGRADTPGGIDGKLEDGRVSRRHARIALDGGRFTVTDLGSQNGTFVDGERLPVNGSRAAGRVIRVGDSLLVTVRDVRPLEERGVRVVDGFVRGPEMQELLDEAARAADGGGTLHVRGETGTGKEGVAQAFHRRSSHAAGRFVPVNCAAIPQNLAERLLFGARRGAYSGAERDADGYIQEADGGTLFLDEIAELDAGVQAKLLRTIESREVMQLGASRPSKSDFQLCSATNKDLRVLVAAGALREDLYFRVGRPLVTVPALRNRPEEIALLVGEELERVAPTLAAHVSLVEQCLLRPWPGNVRELIVEVRAAAQAAAADGSTRVQARHLAASAGSAFGGATAPATAATVASEDAAERAPRKRAPLVDDEWKQRIEEALRKHGGNVTASARELGLHRTQLRRLLERHGIAAGPDDGDDDDPKPDV